MTNFKKLILASLYQELTVSGPPVPTSEELRPYLGEQWTTSHDCITPKQYRDAQIKALAARMTASGIDEQCFMKVMEFIRAEPTA